MEGRRRHPTPDLLSMEGRPRDLLSPPRVLEFAERAASVLERRGEGTELELTMNLHIAGCLASPGTQHDSQGAGGWGDREERRRRSSSTWYCVKR
jgi:hypothetical protein